MKLKVTLFHALVINMFKNNLDFMGMNNLSAEANLEGYVGRALTFLLRNKITVWDEIKFQIDGLEINGILLPAPTGTEDLIFVKLKNGYNVAFSIDKISKIIKMGRKETKYEIPEKKLKILSEKPNVVLIGAGGTIASRIEYGTGAVKPAFSIRELSQAIPEIFSIANVRPIELFNIFSEDMRPDYWIEMAIKVASEINSGVDGVVITHGTDTMQYSASALAFMLQNLAVPVVFTGAQRSSDRPASDAAMNVIHSTLFAAKGEIAESVVCMHASLDDTKSLIHRGVRVRKMHSSRRDAFRTIGDMPLALVQNMDIEYIKGEKEFVNRGKYDKSDTYADAKFCKKTALIYVYPYMDPDIIEVLIDKRYRGIIIAGTGLGHVPENLIDTIRRGIKENIIIAMTTQCIWGPVKLDVYERGRMLRKIGVIPADGMLPETAFVKLGWLLGHDYDKNIVIKKFLSNVRYEIVKSEPINAFFENI